MRATPQVAEPRTEQDIFRSLIEACTNSQAPHAIALIAVRDNYTGYAGKLTGERLLDTYSDKRLVTSEFNALLGCFARTERQVEEFSPEQALLLVDKMDGLLAELHEAMNRDAFGGLFNGLQDGSFQSFLTGPVVREAAFYAGDSAYSFQYRDFSQERYEADAGWLTANKGFDPAQARAILKALPDIHCGMLDLIHKSQSLDQLHTPLAAFRVDVQEISKRSGVDPGVVAAFVEAFVTKITDQNDGYESVDAYSVSTSRPILELGDGGQYLFHLRALSESMYESPQFWFRNDKTYHDTAAKHRGEFTESKLANMLRRTFPHDAVHRGVEIWKGKERVGEIDVLAVFGTIAIACEAKSQKLTLEARSGNLTKVKEDFGKAVQRSYKQLIKSAETFGKDGYRYLLDGNEVELPSISRTFPVVVLADHYPSLAAQVREWLQPSKSLEIATPLVIDLFVVDTLTEMLPSPLRVISYLDLRSEYLDRLLMTGEFSILGHYLKRNLWVESDVAMIALDDTLSADLDAAMLVRREGIAGVAVPKGILTRYQGTFIGRLIESIEHSPQRFNVELGLLLLTWGEETVLKTSRLVEQMVRKTAREGGVHDFSLPFPNGRSGLTFHCNDKSDLEARNLLREHCSRRKYFTASERWFGVCIGSSAAPRFGLLLDFPHTFDYRLEGLRAEQAPLIPFKQASFTLSGKRAPGRNDPCRCGSGRKYKRCCGR
jgi:hypothetical protein